MLAIIPRCEVSVRPAVAGDYAFVDRLAAMHSKALGFTQKSVIEGKIAAGEILIAEDEMRLPIGYCSSSNRYLKRDELGVIYQMNISPGKQRKLVAATLLKEVFERAPFGCRLYCCWCAQDLDANYFWESMRFIPLAFRAGALRRGSGQAAGKGRRPQARTHIFWQCRIRQGDTTTPYWVDRADGVQHRRVVAAAEVAADFFQAVARVALAGEEHADLAREGDALVALLALQVAQADVVVLGHGVDDLLDRDALLLGRAGSRPARPWPAPGRSGLPAEQAMPWSLVIAPSSSRVLFSTLAAM
jgi:hypothetical protein